MSWNGVKCVFFNLALYLNYFSKTTRFLYFCVDCRCKHLSNLYFKILSWLGWALFCLQGKSVSVLVVTAQLSASLRLQKAGLRDLHSSALFWVLCSMTHVMASFYSSLVATWFCMEIPRPSNRESFFFSLPTCFSLLSLLLLPYETDVFFSHSPWDLTCSALIMNKYKIRNQIIQFFSKWLFYLWSILFISDIKLNRQ